MAQLSIYERIIWDPVVVAFEVAKDTFEDFFPQKRLRKYIDLGHFEKDRNGLGLSLEDYRCPRCGFLHATSYSNNNLVRRCRGCLNRFRAFVPHAVTQWTWTTTWTPPK